MPCPFPGMDPYLEAPDIWPDVHDRLANQISADLNAALPSPYYARLEMRPEVGIVEDEPGSRRIVPDVAVVRSQRRPDEAGGVAVADTPRTALSPSFEIHFSSERIRHQFVEIRDPSRGHRLVTLLEIASPANKRRGPDRDAYLRKQREVLESDASLIEIDLLRDGERLCPHPEIEASLRRLEPPAQYVILVNRAWHRTGEAAGLQVFPAHLRDPLPVIPVPLRQGHPEIPLDLQYVFRRVYDAGPYLRGAVAYDRPPRPPLAADLQAWANSRLQAAGLAQ